MDACICSHSISQDFDCKSCAYCFSLDSNLLHVGIKDSFLKDMGVLQPITNEHGLTDDTSDISDIVNHFEATLQVEDVNSFANGQLKKLHTSLDRRDGELQDVTVFQLDACSISPKEILESSDAFFCKQGVILPSQSVDITEGSLCMTSESEGYSEQGHTCNAASSITSVSSNSSQKLVSAMKGSREQQGVVLKAKLSVKWAPDVYDPPVTLVSHTVKSSLRRSKVKKEKHRHKHKSGKVSRASYNGRKQSNRNVEFDNDLQLRLQGPAERLLLRASSSSATKLVEFALNKNESKCGNSFLVNPLAKVHLPVGKAS